MTDMTADNDIVKDEAALVQLLRSLLREAPAHINSLAELRGQS